jgi:predicted SprT family Zn-dependent metalloprotease
MENSLIVAAAAASSATMVATKPLPTREAYSELQQAYDFFNEELFEGQLPSCLITLQREKSTFGYFSAKRFGSIQGGYTDEIAMNPTYFAAVPLLETMQTLAHEMCHLWQHHFGKPGRVRYHNDEWANKMESIGLMPSSTGQPGGRRTGDRMADYAIEGGPFLEATKRLITQDFRISWYDRFGPSNLQAMTQNLVSAQVSSALGLPAAPGRLQHAGQAGDEDADDPTNAAGAAIVVHVPAPAASHKASKVKYTCPCKQNVWGKPKMLLICGVCDKHFEANEVGAS